MSGMHGLVSDHDEKPQSPDADDGKGAKAENHEENGDTQAARTKYRGCRPLGEPTKRKCLCIFFYVMLRATGCSEHLYNIKFKIVKDIFNPHQILHKDPFGAVTVIHARSWLQPDC